MEEKIYKIGEVARRAGVSVRTVERWLAKGLGPDCLIIGTTKLFKEKDIEKFLEKHSQTTEAV
jgi:excisionase family DNA binding protein